MRLDFAVETAQGQGRVAGVERKRLSGHLEAAARHAAQVHRKSAGKSLEATVFFISNFVFAFEIFIVHQLLNSFFLENLLLGPKCSK